MSKSRRLRYTFNSLYLNDGTQELAKDNFHPVKPSYAGDLKYSVQSSDHNGWLKCDGRSLNRERFAKLFEVIGTAFGSDDSETFKLPDCRGRVLGTIGSGTGLTPRVLGALVGAETHTLTVGEMPSHSHSITDPGHTHTYLGVTGQSNAGGGVDTSADEANRPTQTTSQNQTNITINNTGGGGAHNNMQPTIFISNIFIFAY